MFSSLQKSIVGPIVLQEVQMPRDQWVYLIGEDHGLQGSCSHGDKDVVDVADVIRSYAVAHPKEKVVLCLEHSYLAEVYIHLHPHHRVMTPLQRISMVKDQFPRNVVVQFADMRDHPVYLPLQSLYLFHAYCPKLAILKNNWMDNYTSFTQKALALAKAFEKDVILHLSTRTKARNFMEALVLPNKPLPTWYRNHVCKMLDLEDIPMNTPLKEILARVQQTDSVYYDALTSFFHGRLLEWLDQNAHHTRVLHKVMERRKTQSPHLELSKDKELTHFLITLYSCIQDLAMMARARLEECQHLILVTGAAHSFHMSPFFTSLGTQSIYGFDKGGCIHLVKHGQRNTMMRISDATMQTYFDQLLTRYQI